MSATKRQTQQQVIRPKLIGNLLIERFEPKHAERKAELSRQLIDLFFRYDGAAFAPIKDQLVDKKRELSEAKKQLKRLEVLEKELAALTNSADVIRWANDKNITIPGDLAQSQIKPTIVATYASKITNVKADIERLTNLVKTCEEAAKKCETDLKKFKKEQKTQYNAWKNEVFAANDAELKALKEKLKSAAAEDYTNISKEIEKRSNKFEFLRLALLGLELSPMQRENYTCRLEKDTISHQMVRFAEADKILSHYTSKVVEHFVENAYIEYIRSVRSQVDTILECGKVTELPSLSLDHVNVARFSPGAICSTYLGLVNVARDGVEPSDDERNSKMYKAVEAHIRKVLKSNVICKNSKFDVKLVTLIARVALAYNKMFFDIISRRMEHNGIRTIQSRIINDIVELSYVTWGEKPYEVVKERRAK